MAPIPVLSDIPFFAETAHSPAVPFFGSLQIRIGLRVRCLIVFLICETKRPLGWIRSNCGECNRQLWNRRKKSVSDRQRISSILRISSVIEACG